MRFAIGGLMHESNVFAPGTTGLDAFQVLDGEGIVRLHQSASSTLAGFLAGCQRLRAEAVPVFFAEATPSGPIGREAFESLARRLVDALAERQWDAVLLALHGAAVAEHHSDADGELLRRIRTALGPDVPVVAAVDLHANVSPLMVAGCDAVVAYRTNPHVDAADRAQEAVRIAIQAVSGRRPSQALVMIPAALNILRQHTGEEPMAGLLASLRETLARPGVLSASLLEGFHWADVPEMGMSVVAVTEGDRALASSVAGELARAVWSRRGEFDGSALPVGEALDRVDRARSGPALLLDVGDNIGAGSPGDSVVILREAIRRRVRGLFASIAAPDAVQRCRVAGTGSRVDLVVGAASDPTIGPPVPLGGTVRGLHDGRFEDPRPTHGGRRHFDAGPTAVVDLPDDITVALTTYPLASHSPAQLTSLGLDPARLRAIVAKGVHSPLAGYGPVVSRVVAVDTPGCTAADLSRLAYSRRRRPLYPFESDITWHP